jgi:hypothetical protein
MTKKIECGSVVSNNKALDKAAREGKTTGPDSEYGYPFNDACYGAGVKPKTLRTESYVDGHNATTGEEIVIEFDKGATKAQGFLNKYKGGF